MSSAEGWTYPTVKLSNGVRMPILGIDVLTHLMEFCRHEGIAFQGYCRLAKGQVLSSPIIIQLAQKYGRTPAQICIRWSVENGVNTIPKSTKKEHQAENYQVLGFQLDEKDMLAINKMHDGKRVLGSNRCGVTQGTFAAGKIITDKMLVISFFLSYLCHC